MLTQPALSQKRIKLENSDKVKMGKRGTERYQRLIGNVVMKQTKTTIYCDSAHFFKSNNSVEAFGHVRIVDGDSITITSNRLEYDGDTRKAKLRSNVVFTKKGESTLYTDFLDYDRQQELVTYFNNGRLVDSVNVLTSRRGYYDMKTNLSSFKQNVVVTNPDYSMSADSLRYDSRNKMIYFVAPTTVIDKDSATFVYETGKYDTKTKKADLKKGQGENDNYKIEAMQYTIDDKNKVYRFRENVVMNYKSEKLIIRSQASDVYKLSNITKIYNRAYLAKLTDEGDTLFMTADTLVSIDSEDERKKRVLAYGNVKIFKSDLQGIADSLEYRVADSTLIFYKNPVLWSDESQFSADSIQMFIANNTINRIFLNTNAFVVSEDTIIHDFNQIKGRTMTAFFKDQQLHRVYVDGNAENLYFALDEKNNSLMGMNKIICSRITIRFKEGKLDTFSSYVKPEAEFIPPHELEDGDRRLRGFSWHKEKRPVREDVVKKQR
jgi:lipopolysaccharide export system protein LptA